MPSMNKVQIMGHMGKDPEVRYMPGGDAVANVSVATTEKWKDKRTGEAKERTEWHSLVFYRRQAEIVGQYLKKGSLVMVEGSIRTRTWEKEGKTNYRTEIVVSQLYLLDRKSADDSEGHRRTEPATASPSQAQTGYGEDDIDDDIPF